MAKLSSDGTYVVVEKGDTLWDIAKQYLGSATNYKQLGAINDIPNLDLIYPGQKVYLSKTSSSSSSASSSTSSSSKPTINQFGLQSDADGVLFATWNWNKDNTDSYKVLWEYYTEDSIWFVGSDSTIKVDEDNPDAARQSLYNIPKNAKQVRFKVKPISKTYTKNNTETKYWEASWSATKTYSDYSPSEPPPVPSVEIENYKLTAFIDNLKLTGGGFQFEIVKDNRTVFNTGNAYSELNYVSYSCFVDAGAEYKARVRWCNERGWWSEWSDYSSNASTIPASPQDILILKATSETSVYLEWNAAGSATGYEIEYTNKQEYFDGSNETTTVSTDQTTHYDLTGLETGLEYFFRVRATNDAGSSPWSNVRSVVIGKDPSAPTTWSSTTTVITGEPLILYWVHNTEDGSSQTYADLELTINGVKKTEFIKNTDDEELKDKTSSYVIDTTDYIEGTKILWRVRTAGITNKYSDWSIQRTVDVYAPPTLELKMVDSKSNTIQSLTGFPFEVSAIPGPKTQTPIGYHLTITANESYETVDSIGNAKYVNAGDAVYSRYFDINTALSAMLSAGDIDLENNISYTTSCTVAMNSGLTADAAVEFDVNWTDTFYEPNAEIGLNEENYTTSIRPYCRTSRVTKRRVSYAGYVYTTTSEEVEDVWGSVMPGVRTVDGRLVYSGVDADGESLYYTVIEEEERISNVTLSVYRREFDGSFTELATGLDGAKNTTITDPHPALDYARYRIVAITKDTGSVSYYDPPGYPVHGDAVIIQWDEAWSNFETSEQAAMEQPPWSGSLLRLPYNIDVSDNHKNDVTLVEYIGRSHPISYYGTQLGETSTWNLVIDKSDKETLYGLRRLAKWMGDVYVREPSGSGYWANVTVSFSQRHCELTIPVTLEIARVEGGA